jgi:hypothetical protein
LGGKGFAGGLFTAHDWIGHMEYDKLGRTSELLEAKTGGTISDPKLQALISDAGTETDALVGSLYAIFTSIQVELERLIEVEMDLDQEEEQKTIVESKLNKLEKELEALTANPPPHPIATSIPIVRPLVDQIARTQNELVTIKENILNNKIFQKELCLKIYGIEGSYTPGKPKSNEPGGQRTPDVEILKSSARHIFETGAKDSVYWGLLAQLIDLQEFTITAAQGNASEIFELMELYDDRTVGNVKKGINPTYQTKYGYRGTAPSYIYLIGKET